MANDDYVPILDRVRVVDCPWPGSELLLLMQSGDMRIESGERRGPLEEKAVLIRKAMECLAEAVRERCAEKAAELISSSDPEMFADVLAGIVANAIEGLEL